jgi:hypothetical protein
MASIYEVKGREITETPLLLFECELPSGAVERWSTHTVEFAGHTYAARVLRHDDFEIRAASEDGVDAVSRASIVLANADSYFSQLQRNIGLKGSKLQVSFVFFDLSAERAASEAIVVFRGICNPPDEITDSSIRLTFTSRMNLQRVLLPDVRIQKRCPWIFPGSPEAQAEAVDGGVKGRYSPYFRCGYSPGQEDGCGNPGFKSCDYTRTACVERGMFDKDSIGRDTRRFAGIEFVPSTITVKSYGEKAAFTSSAVENEGKYNDFVPIVYGTAWYRPPIVFARNDGNLTHLEVLLGIDEIDGVVKVVVNGNELPVGQNTIHATATGWYNIVGYGHRTGAFNLDFADASGRPQGDPYGSMAVLSVVVPNRISDGTPLPKIDVLLRGLKLDEYDETGSHIGRNFTNNPAWVILDLLRRSGWQPDEIDLPSFARTAAYCSEAIDTTDLNGGSQIIPRFQCNLVLKRRRSASDVIRGVRNGSGLYLTYGAGGLLQLHAESAIFIQHSTKPEGSNATSDMNGGWPAFEFGDGTSGFSDIVRQPGGKSSLRVWSRTTAESPNRFSTEFQDEFNEYQQDSLSLVEIEDAAATGYEVNGTLAALGLPNYNQAARILRLALDKSIRGNTYVEFETGLRSFGIAPGDLITVTYRKEGFERQLFRVIRLRPGLNYHRTVITAQIHDDAWYAGGDGSLGLIGGGHQPYQDGGVPRALAGVILNEDGQTDFSVAESYIERADGTFDVELTVGFSAPSRPTLGAPPVPLLSLAPRISASGGTLSGDQDLYYALSATSEDGGESPLSFVVRAAVPAVSETNQVTLERLSFGTGTTAFHVYRGTSPAQLVRVATSVPLSLTFTDAGAEDSTSVPPDHNYNHANFYWRLELLPEYQAVIRSEATIGNPELAMIVNEYRDKTVRITRGRGRGQERIIRGNDATTLSLSGRWVVEPDETSRFVVAEPSWNFGAQTDTSPVRFVVPNRQNAYIHITGRSANVHDRECAAELSPLTRHNIGGAAADADVPDAPVFALATAGQGRVELGAIGFTDLTNTRSVMAGTLTLHCWNELEPAATAGLQSAIGVEDETLRFQQQASLRVGGLVQIGREILVVRSVAIDGMSAEVDRGRYDTDAGNYEPGEPLFALERKAYVLPFVAGFFGTPASGSYSHSLALPNARIVVAELYVTNARGNSQVSTATYANTVDHGLRTLSGGQYTFQVDGPLAIQSSAVPTITVDGDKAVRDVFARVIEPPRGSQTSVRVTLDGEPYCELTIPPGQSRSNVVDGRLLPAVFVDSQLGLDVLETGRETPGAGLTVTVRV